MDQDGTNKEELMHLFARHLGEGVVDFSVLSDNESDDVGGNGLFEAVAVCDDSLLEEYLDGCEITNADISRLIRQRKLFPCFFGSALKLEGVKEFLDAFTLYAVDTEEKQLNEFGARVFKIARDNKGERLTYMKVTCGCLKVKDVLVAGKVNQIRIYSGEKYETVPEAGRGQVIAVTGLSDTHPGQGLGTEMMNKLPALEPVLTYSLIYPEDIDKNVMISKLRELEEEEPELHVSWQEKTCEIQVKLMGEVQTEIIRNQI